MEFLHINLGTLREKCFIVQNWCLFWTLFLFQLSVVTLGMSSQLEANLSPVSTVKELPIHWKNHIGLTMAWSQIYAFWNCTNCIYDANGFQFNCWNISIRMTQFVVNGMFPPFSFGLLNAGSLVGLTHSLSISGIIEKAGLSVLMPCMFWQCLRSKYYE